MSDNTPKPQVVLNLSEEHRLKLKVIATLKRRPESHIAEQLLNAVTVPGWDKLYKRFKAQMDSGKSIREVIDAITPDSLATSEEVPD